MDDDFREWCAEQMNKLPEVRWDRCTLSPVGCDATAYGWIDRPDGRSDFVVLFLGERFGFVTSSAEHSRSISERLLGRVEGHRSCQRVGDVFGALVGNKVEPGGDSPLVAFARTVGTMRAFQRAHGERGYDADFLLAQDLGRQVDENVARILGPVRQPSLPFEERKDGAA